MRILQQSAANATRRKSENPHQEPQTTGIQERGNPQYDRVADQRLCQSAVNVSDPSTIQQPSPRCSEQKTVCRNLLSSQVQWARYEYKHVQETCNCEGTASTPRLAQLMFILPLGQIVTRPVRVSK